MAELKTKTCRKCNKEKNFPKEFHKHGKKYDGSYYYHYCKQCKNDISKQHNIKTGKTKTIRGTPKDNLINKRFGLLVVVKHCEYKQLKKQNAHTWVCKCDCGNEKIVIEYCLKNGTVKSCGCLCKITGEKHQNFKGYKDISSQYWSVVKTNAKNRNLEFNITIEYVWELFLKQGRKCALSSVDIHFAISYKKEKGTASLDRIDSKIGYIEENVQWVHKDVNKMKQNLLQDNSIFFCKKIADNKGLL